MELSGFLVLGLPCLLSLLTPGLTKEDYYKTLGLNPSATEREIKKSFRKLAMKYHPDKNQDKGADEKFRDIAEGIYTIPLVPTHYFI
jgi:preprotein translocase subunit Sec63